MSRVLILLGGFCICAYMIWLTVEPIITALMENFPF